MVYYKKSYGKRYKRRSSGYRRKSYRRKSYGRKSYGRKYKKYSKRSSGNKVIADKGVGYTISRFVYKQYCKWSKMVWRANRQGKDSMCDRTAYKASKKNHILQWTKAGLYSRYKDIMNQQEVAKVSTAIQLATSRSDRERHDADNSNAATSASGVSKKRKSEDEVEAVATNVANDAMATEVSDVTGVSAHTVEHDERRAEGMLFHHHHG